jgi:hypothetical protein
MKFIRLTLPVVALLSVSTLTFAQADTEKPPTNSEKSFTQLKALAGTWEGRVTTTPAKYDHPVTMFYLDNDRLLLTHYCDAGNRPRMVARTSPDGKTIEFDFIDLSGGTEHGHMDHAVFTVIDANHHTEDWTYMMPGDKPMRAHFDLTRTK